MDPRGEEFLASLTEAQRKAMNEFRQAAYAIIRDYIIGDMPDPKRIQAGEFTTEQLEFFEADQEVRETIAYSLMVDQVSKIIAIKAKKLALEGLIAWDRNDPMSEPPPCMHVYVVQMLTNIQSQLFAKVEQSLQEARARDDESEGGHHVH